MSACLGDLFLLASPAEGGDARRILAFAAGKGRAACSRGFLVASGTARLGCWVANQYESFIGERNTLPCSLTG